MDVLAITASGTNQVADPAKPRNFLGIYNQSASATVYVAFDTAAVAAATAGQITLVPLGTGGVAASSVVWNAADPRGVPQHAINIIASAGSTPVTLIE